jgi:hypothetical protein
MHFDCPKAPLYGPIARLQTFVLAAGATLIRFHRNNYLANSFNPNIGKNWSIPEDGARFNPFPGGNSANVPTVYVGDHFAAAALESVFQNVPHVPSPQSWRPNRI